MYYSFNGFSHHYKIKFKTDEQYVAFVDFNPNSIFPKDFITLIEPRITSIDSEKFYDGYAWMQYSSGYQFDNDKTFVELLYLTDAKDIQVIDNFTDKEVCVFTFLIRKYFEIARYVYDNLSKYSCDRITTNLIIKNFLKAFNKKVFQNESSDELAFHRSIHSAFKFVTSGSLIGYFSVEMSSYTKDKWDRYPGTYMAERIIEIGNFDFEKSSIVEQTIVYSRDNLRNVVCDNIMLHEHKFVPNPRNDRFFAFCGVFETEEDVLGMKLSCEDLPSGQIFVLNPITCS